MDDRFHVSGVGSVVPGRFGGQPRESGSQQKRRSRRGAPPVAPGDPGPTEPDTYAHQTTADPEVETRLRRALERRQRAMEAHALTWSNPAVKRLTFATVVHEPHVANEAARADVAAPPSDGPATGDTRRNALAELDRPGRDPLTAYETADCRPEAPPHLVDTEG